ncbi:hypothetical protein Hbl1158_03630 [Halobaculum sp. CBA1158]|uniref:DUF7269 family protein n=1 Tax=Halobaculum sp. CBA1158 TaxID=2904243 RepID=UPI001F3432D6|nr:hypothetical protein [Halobaculum sp. CBA1158]UIP00466.1 hypothetical protein Hbl1158_03630 [Halobaculum sp. CBA1158]
MRRSAILGVAAVTFGFVVVLQRGLAAAFDLTYVFVTAAGVLALVQGLRYANEARTADRRAIETGDPEERYVVPVPGDDADDLVYGSGRDRASIKRRRQFRQRLRRAAAGTLRARGDYADGDEDGDGDAVEVALDDGTWTDDAVAAWYLGEDVPPPRAVRVRSLFGADTEFRFAVDRTVDALAAARDGAAGDDADAVDAAGADAAFPETRRSARRVAESVARAGRRRIDAVGDALAGVRR